MTINDQETWANRMADRVGPDLALFYACIVFNVPYQPDHVPEDNTGSHFFREYLDNRKAAGEKTDDTFWDGELDIMKVLGPPSLPEPEPEEEPDSPQGTRTQQKNWGPASGGKRYTKAEYDRMDAIYASYSQRLESAGGCDTQQEFILRLCSRMTLQMEEMLAKGAFDKAAKLNKMIQDNLASENLRKKDEKPVENVRVDNIMDALEKAGFLKQGKILSMREVQKLLLERLGALGGHPSHIYPYTMDAADQMILAIVNTMRTNDGLPELAGLPDNLRLDQNVAPEFAPTPNDDEEEVYRRLGIVRGSRLRNGKMITPEQMEAERRKKEEERKRRQKEKRNNGNETGK